MPQHSYSVGLECQKKNQWLVHDVHERPGISGARPGLAGFHQSWNSGGDQPGNHQGEGSGAEDIQKENMINQTEKVNYFSMYDFAILVTR